LENKENIDTDLIASAIKDYIRNHEKYNLEKKRLLDFISNVKN